MIDKFETEKFAEEAYKAGFNPFTHSSIKAWHWPDWEVLDAGIKAAIIETCVQFMVRVRKLERWGHGA